MAWRKLGLIFDLAQHKIPWLKSHAMLPSPLLIDDRIRVYFTGRDQSGISRISFVDLKRSDPAVIIYVHSEPILSPSKLGAFDDSGTLGTCVVQNGDRIYLYYNGYNRRVTVPYHNSIGLAVSQDGGRDFRRAFDGPIIDRGPSDPYFNIASFVKREGDLWYMWYASGTAWIMVGDKAESLYVIKHAESVDGINWKRKDAICIAPLFPEEANVRAAVVKDGKRYKMWYCFRGSRDFRDGADSYRIGYAEGSDPIHWTRDDSKAGIVCGPDEWDSRMQAYPAVIDVDGSRYMFYNGNGFGFHGFGCAIWE